MEENAFVPFYILTHAQECLDTLRLFAYDTDIKPVNAALCEAVASHSTLILLLIRPTMFNITLLNRSYRCTA